MPTFSSSRALAAAALGLIACATPKAQAQDSTFHQTYLIVDNILSFNGTMTVPPRVADGGTPYLWPVSENSNLREGVALPLTVFAADGLNHLLVMCRGCNLVETARFFSLFWTAEVSTGIGATPWWEILAGLTAVGSRSRPERGFPFPWSIRMVTGIGGSPAVMELVILSATITMLRSR